MKIDDANDKCLKVGSAAASAPQLGGLTPDAFFQGAGQVVTGAISSLPVGNTATPLLTVPSGIAVSIANTVGSGLQLEIGNPTSQSLAAVMTSEATSASGATELDLAAGRTAFIPFSTTNAGVGKLHIQILPNSGLPEVVTIIISVDNASVVGQAFCGPS